jgi:hypothetical protein
MSKLHKHRSINQKLTVVIERKMVEIASKNPREGYDNLPTLLDMVIKDWQDMYQRN